jgi:hypothetical protein
MTICHIKCWQNMIFEIEVILVLERLQIFQTNKMINTNMTAFNIDITFHND